MSTHKLLRDQGLFKSLPRLEARTHKVIGSWFVGQEKGMSRKSVYTQTSYCTLSSHHLSLCLLMGSLVLLLPRPQSQKPTPQTPTGLLLVCSLQVHFLSTIHLKRTVIQRLAHKLSCWLAVFSNTPTDYLGLFLKYRVWLSMSRFGSEILCDTKLLGDVDVSGPQATTV